MAPRVITMTESREAVAQFPRVNLLQGYASALIPCSPLLKKAEPPNIRVLLKRFIVNPAHASTLLVRMSLNAIDRTSNEFVSASLVSQLEINEMVDPSKPIELEFLALENLTLDCGLVYKVKRLV